ncbi:MAG TPA: hypothetical protein PKV41_04170 [Candidatus Omnitrophota bacterium]|nr:hypothetical protein [Candidatus Omnitrophota bacterium]
MNPISRPTRYDFIALAFFAVLITLHPYYLREEINLFELGIYLPGIDAVLQGQVPYRDFFHLRGSMELYLPAFLMQMFGKNIATLSTYFYVGTALTLVIAVGLAKEIYRTRFVLYLAIPVLIARTFPRVAFTFWGGIRYGFGLLGILLAVFALKQKRPAWFVLSGIAAVLALLTSVEVGACSIASIFMGFIFAWYFSIYTKKETLKFFLSYLQGLAIVLFPYGLYLLITRSLGPYFDSVYSVINIMTNVFPDASFSDHPNGILQGLLAMNPCSPHFKHLTPVYCYLFFLVYLILRIRKRKVDQIDLSAVLIAVYGFMMYVLAFRKLGAMQFEMALQPEKLLLFFLLEKVFVYLMDVRERIRQVRPLQLRGDKYWPHWMRMGGIYFLVFSFFMSSVGYSLARYNHRFFSLKYVRYLLTGKDVRELIPLSGEKTERLAMDRVKGMTVPAWQAEDIRGVTEYVHRHTELDEPVFMFPELGAYSFIVDRPFVGRFPMVTFSWFGGWHEELWDSLRESGPRVAVIAKDPGPFFEKVYFQVPKNEEYYRLVTDYISQNYDLVETTHSLNIYQRK